MLSFPSFPLAVLSARTPARRSSGDDGREHIRHAGWGRFRTTDLHATVAEPLDKTTESYTLGQLRYDLGKLRGKGLVERVAGTQSYWLPSEGYRIAVLYLKLFHRIYAPLTAGIIEPVPWDDRVPPERRALLDCLYAAVDRDLNQLFDSVGLRLAG